MNKIAHNIILACVVLLAFQSCSSPTPLNQNPNITADNLVEEIVKQVKHYPSEPQYVMHYFNGVCNFEIYINDFKVVKSFNNESFKTSERINPFLLSKNNQLKIILYPRDSVNKLNLQAGLDLKVNSYENTDRFSIEKQQKSNRAGGNHLIKALQNHAQSTRREYRIKLQIIYINQRHRQQCQRSNNP